MKAFQFFSLVCVLFCISCGGSSSGTADGSPADTVHDYELDQTFNKTGFFRHHDAAGGDSSERGQSVAVTPDGRIVVSGYSYNENGNMDLAVWMLNPDGTLEPTFNGKGWFTHHNAAGGNGDDSGNSVAITKDGKIIVSGYSMGKNAFEGVVWCLNMDGTLDASFNPLGTTPGWLVLERPDAEEAKSSYTAATSLAVADDDTILVAGFYAYEVGELDYYENLMVWRLTLDARLDTSFNETGIFIFDAATEGRDTAWAYQPKSIAVDANDNILIAGYHMDPFSGATWGGLWRLTYDGRLDASFNESGYLFPTGDDWFSRGFESVAIAEGKIYITGGFRFHVIEDDSWRDYFGLFAFDLDGTLATIYKQNIADGDQQEGVAVTITSDHQAIVGGFVMYHKQGSEPDTDMAIWWLDLDATDLALHTGREYFTQNFGTGPYGTDRIQSLVATPEGKIAAAGFSKSENGDWDMAVWQLH